MHEAGELWNICLALWLNPFAYAPGSLEAALPHEDVKLADLGPLGALPAEPWDVMAHALLDLLEMQALLPEKPHSEEADNEDDLGLFKDDDSGDEEPKGQPKGGGRRRKSKRRGSYLPMDLMPEDGPDEDLGDGKLKVDLEWVSKFVAFAMGCLLVGRQWVSVVVVGRRLCELTLNFPTAAESAFPLLLHAQRAIVATARGEAKRCEVPATKRTWCCKPSPLG